MDERQVQQSASPTTASKGNATRAPSEVVWFTYTLYSVEGKSIARVRLPASPFPSPILQCGAQFYKYHAYDGVYRETRCHYIPIDRMEFLR